MHRLGWHERCQFGSCRESNISTRGDNQSIAYEEQYVIFVLWIIRATQRGFKQHDCKHRRSSTSSKTLS